MAVITISRQVGTGGEQVAAEVAKRLGYHYFDKRYMVKAAAEAGLSENEVVDFSEENYRVISFLDQLLGTRARVVAKVSTRQRTSTGAETLSVEQFNEAHCIELIRTTMLAAYRQGNVVILGRGGQAILQDQPGVLHVRLEAPLGERADRIQQQRKLSGAEARSWAQEQDRKMAEYLKRFFGVRWDDTHLYHLVINTGKLPPLLAARLIAETAVQFEPEPAAAF